MANVILIGMPGSGKSTIGVLLAKRLAFSFLDTDLVIQSAKNARLSQLIAENGLSGFCDMESAHIQSISCQQTVIATGGSVVYRSQAMSHLKDLGVVVFLDVAPDMLDRRLGDLDTRGVVLAAGQTLEDLHNERIPLYHQYADIRISCGERTPDQLTEAVTQLLSPQLSGMP